MTTCSKMFEALDKRLDAKMSIDDIGKELCDSVNDPRAKVVRLIRELYEEDADKFLIDNAELARI